VDEKQQPHQEELRTKRRHLGRGILPDVRRQHLILFIVMLHVWTAYLPATIRAKIGSRHVNTGCNTKEH
jgi:hypothetical protein